jgi:hypothetical protein
MKKEDYIHILETILKDAMEWYGYDPKKSTSPTKQGPKAYCQGYKASMVQGPVVLTLIGHIVGHPKALI